MRRHVENNAWLIIVIRDHRHCIVLISSESDAFRWNRLNSVSRLVPLGKPSRHASVN